MIHYCSQDWKAGAKAVGYSTSRHFSVCVCVRVRGTLLHSPSRVQVVLMIQSTLTLVNSEQDIDVTAKLRNCLAVSITSRFMDVTA